MLSVIGCGSDDEATPTGNCDNGATGTIANNHGHNLAVTAADV